MKQIHLKQNRKFYYFYSYMHGIRNTMVTWIYFFIENKTNQLIQFTYIHMYVYRRIREICKSDKYKVIFPDDKKINFNKLHCFKYNLYELRKKERFF